MRAGRFVLLCVAAVMMAGCNGLGSSQQSESQFGWWNSHPGWWNAAAGPALTAAERGQPFCTDAERMYAKTEYLSTYVGSLGVERAALQLERVFVWANAAAAKAPTPALETAFGNYSATLGVAVTMGLAIDVGKSSQAFSGPMVGRVPARQNLLMFITSSRSAVPVMRAFLAQVEAACPRFRP